MPFAWAGRMWSTDQVTYDAHPNEVPDLLMEQAQRGLSILWPDDYVAPDGSMPGRVKAVADHPKTTPTNPIERALAAERESALATSRAIAAEREVVEMRSTYEARIGEVRRDLTAARERVDELTRAVSDAEKRAVAAVERAQDADRAIGEAVARVRAEHSADVDTLMAQHASEVEALSAERDRLTAANAALTAEMERLTAPTATAAPVKKAPRKPDADAPTG